jgi:hypothetical protein
VPRREFLLNIATGGFRAPYGSSFNHLVAMILLKTLLIEGVADTEN